MKFSSQNSILGSNPIAGYVTKVFVFGIDLAFALLAITSALLITGEFELARLNLLLTWGPVLLLVFRFISFFAFRTYLIIIRYVGEKDYKNVFYAISLASACFFLLLRFIATPFKPQEVLPIVLVDYFVLLFLCGGSRIMLRLVFDKLRVQGVNRLNTVIFGAGELGAMLDRVLSHNASHNYKVVAFFDDNPRVHKKYLNGIRIFNPEPSFARVVKQYNIKYAIIGINNLPEARRVQFINNCLAHQVKVLKVPPMEHWLNNTLNLGQLMNIKFDDLLSRLPIELDQHKISTDVQGKVILVTGCAGSIGSEIVQQLLPYAPKLLVGLDQAETPLAEMGLALREYVTAGVFQPVIADVRDNTTLQHLFEKYQPEYVFHAAAYKHVPIMEYFPLEAVRTNVKGTMNLAKLAVKHRVRKFVMISTDKAVNPSNIMGASKRIAEIFVQALNDQATHNTQFITTRFGNVLGSNGSVIPIFKRQIEQGGPVTVTHPEVTRFFMTIPEACQLVLEAGSMGNGGEIFVFDMGESVKIIDLAKKMIQLAGLTPGQDITIKFTGLRPGEKLYEELLDDREGTLPTHHPKIKKALVRANDYVHVTELIDQLVLLTQNADEETLVRLMKTIVPEFTSQNSVFKKLDIPEKSQNT